MNGNSLATRESIRPTIGLRKGIGISAAQESIPV